MERNWSTAAAVMANPTEAREEIHALRAEVENLRRRLSDVLEGLEGMTLPGAMPVRIAKARAAFQAAA